MTTPTLRLPLDGNALSAMTIRDIIDADSRALEILAPHGFDLCCGGSHQLGHAMSLHGVDPDTVLPDLARLAADPQS